MSSSQQNTVKTMEGAVGVRDFITLTLLLILGMVLMSYLVSSLLTRCKPLGEHLTASLFGKSTEETSESVVTDGQAPLRYDRQRGWVAVAGMPYDNVYDSAAHRGNVIMRSVIIAAPPRPLLQRPFHHHSDSSFLSSSLTKRYASQEDRSLGH